MMIVDPVMFLTRDDKYLTELNNDWVYVPIRSCLNIYIMDTFRVSMSHP